MRWQCLFYGSEYIFWEFSLEETLKVGFKRPVGMLNVKRFQCFTEFARSCNYANIEVIDDLPIAITTLDSLSLYFSGLEFARACNYANIVVIDHLPIAITTLDSLALYCSGLDVL